MMIPIAIDLSNHDAFPEHQPDATDYKSLLKSLEAAPCVLLYNGEELATSTLVTQQTAIPIKFRDRYQALLKRLPKQKITAWNGVIDQHLPPFAYEHAHILAVSRATYCVELEYDLDQVPVHAPAAPNAEITLWKSIDSTTIYETVSALLHREIIAGERRSELWRERLEPVFQQVKWRTISMVDRFLIGDDKHRDYTAVDFFISKLNKSLRFPVTLNLFIESNTPRYAHKNPGPTVDAANDLLQHISSAVAPCQYIQQVNIYALHKTLIRDEFHDRFLFLHTSDELLYTYSFGVGFTIFGAENIDRTTTFQLKVDLNAQENRLFQSLSDIRPVRSVKPEYAAAKVCIFLCTQ